MTIRFKGFVHPTNGTIVLADSEEALAEAVLAADLEIRKLRNLRAPIQERLAELRGPANLPKRRYQTDRQRLVARCPRCGGTVGGDRAA